MNSQQTNTLESDKKDSVGRKELIEIQAELEACATSPLYFLKNYAKIRDKNKGVIDFYPYEHIVYLLECFAKYPLIIILKAKQICVTWTVQLSNLHMALFEEGAQILTLSKGEDEAGEELDYCRFAHSQLPDFLRLPLGKDGASLITFPRMHSKMRALPATAAAGVGFGGAKRVVMDEFEYHPNDELNYAEVIPIVREGGQLIIMSTADKTKVGTKFKEVYQMALRGDNNFFKIFLPYDVLPNRDAAWYQSLYRDLKASEVECRYPRTENEALETLKSMPFFDNAILEGWKRDVLSPIKSELSDQFKTVTVFKEPVVGRRYVQFADPSDGADDPHAIVVKDAVSGEWVAVSHGKTKADYAASIHDGLVRYYNNAFNGNEINSTAGGTFDSKLEALDTPNRAFRVKSDRKLDLKKHGWHTGSALRQWLNEALEEAVRLQKVRIYFKPALDEMIAYMRPEGEDPQAPKGGHDDFIAAGGGCECLMNYLPQTREITISSGHYKESR